MLSYDTRKSDELISKAPSDIPEELIPGNQLHHGQTAIKVPEDAGKAAIERHISRPVHLETSYLSEMSRTKPIEVQTIIRRESEEPQVSGLVKPEQLKVDGRTMTRAEYIRYVRERCEQELAYYAKFNPEPKSIVPECEEGIEEPLSEEQLQEITIEPVETEELPLVMLEHLNKEQYEEEPLESTEARKKDFLRVLWIRSIIAICLFIGIVSFDLLNVQIGNAGIGEVKDVVGNNRTIQKIEQIVSDFAEDTILPVFGMDSDKKVDDNKPAVQNE